MKGITKHERIRWLAEIDIVCRVFIDTRLDEEFLNEMVRGGGGLGNRGCEVRLVKSMRLPFRPQRHDVISLEEVDVEVQDFVWKDSESEFEVTMVPQAVLCNGDVAPWFLDGWTLLDPPLAFDEAIVVAEKHGGTLRKLDSGLYVLDNDVNKWFRREQERVRRGQQSKEGGGR